MLSKIIIVLLSVLLIVLSLSFLGKFPDLEIQSLLVPNFDKLDFSNVTLIVMFATSLILMILGILFSSIESSTKVNNLLNFLQKGMPDEGLNKLDRVSKSIAEYIKGIGGADIEPVQKVTKDEEVNEDISESKEVSESKEEDLPFDDMRSDTDDFSSTEEDFSPDLPNPNEFDDNEKKTVVASSFDLEQLKSSKTESNNDYQPSNFSDFSEDEDSSEGAETIIASVPEELLNQIKDSQVNSKESAFKAVYKKYYDMKVELGESVASLTEEAFLKKLSDTEKKIIGSNNCKNVEFTVYNKNNKAALKAIPKY